MVSCLLKLILKKKPVVPTANKWTKRSACHLFFWFGNAAHGCLHLLFSMGCGKMRFDPEGKAGNIPDGADPALKSDAN